jgi:hypothetical protein
MNCARTPTSSRTTRPDPQVRTMTATGAARASRRPHQRADIPTRHPARGQRIVSCCPSATAVLRIPAPARGQRTAGALPHRPERLVREGVRRGYALLVAASTAPRHQRMVRGWPRAALRRGGWADEAAVPWTSRSPRRRTALRSVRNEAPGPSGPSSRPARRPRSPLAPGAF